MPATAPAAAGVEEKDDSEALMMEDVRPAVEVLAPGAYRSICVELKLHHLAVCALAQVGGGAGTQGIQVHQHRAQAAPLRRVCTGTGARQAGRLGIGCGDVGGRAARQDSIGQVLNVAGVEVKALLVWWRRVPL